MLSRTPAQRAGWIGLRADPGAHGSDTPPRATNAVGKLTRFAVRRGVTGPTQATAGALIYRVEYSRMRTFRFRLPHPQFRSRTAPVYSGRNGIALTISGRARRPHCRGPVGL